jgi:hypothetical protein
MMALEMIRNIKIDPETFLKRQGEFLLIFNVVTDDLIKVTGDAAVMLELIKEKNLANESITEENLVEELLKKSESFRNNPEKSDSILGALKYFHKKSVIIYDA